MIDQLRQMAIFAKAIDHGSFRGAATALRLSPSVVSHHIAQLEEHLGVALIYRSTRKLTLTREGERLLVATRKMLNAAEGELLHLSASASVPSGELRMTAPSVLSQSAFMEQIAAFSRAYPRIQLSLDFSDTRRDMIENGFDFAIRMGTSSSNSATSRKLFRVKRKLIASSAYVAARPTANKPDELMDWDWLALSPAQNIPLVFQNKQAGKITLKPEARLFTNDAQALYQLARAGAGLAMVPDFLAEKDITAGAVKHILSDWQLSTLDVYAIWPANAPKHGLIHLVLDAFNQRTNKAKPT